MQLSILPASAGAASMRRFHRRQQVWVVRASGVLFLGFASLAVVHGAAGLRRSLSR